MFLLTDVLIVAVSLYMAFAARFEFAIPHNYLAMFYAALPVFILVKLIFFSLFGLYRITWRFVGLNELNKIILSTVVSEAVIMVMLLIPLADKFAFVSQIQIAGFPRGVFLMDAFMTILFLSGIRISKRVWLEIFRSRGKKDEGKRTLIIGAGNTGSMMLRDMEQKGYADYYPVGFVDDDKALISCIIRGVKVLGSIDQLRGIIAKTHAEAVIIAIPSLNHKTLKDIYGFSKKCGINDVKIVPRLYDTQHPGINLKNLEEIKIEDLIGRQAVEVDQQNITRFLSGKSVLITGAGGSIGSEIVMQVCSFNPGHVLLFDIDETELHSMSIKIARSFSDMIDKCSFITGDVRDPGRLGEVFAAFKPDIVFHAAAYKHVPMMELNAKEALKVNVVGTENLVQASLGNHIEKFIMISTDKAVMPTSIMGASKRVAEYLCTERSNEQTEFVCVRFGNVLGSRGSVLPLFMDQLKDGGPLTVTHPDMQRYFMTIPEAVSLVLQASTIGKGGDVLVLDMGEPVKIVSLAEELIKIHGLMPYEDIDIVFTGMRPGEKLFEEILTAEEGTRATRSNKIFSANRSNGKIDVDTILKECNKLLSDHSISQQEESSAVREFLKRHVRHYDGRTSA
ncbi:MAG: nucleoside-diphosphate sugar epimerase/dehydratase [Dissulfurispiraceae bacterium]|nr:nucleoside-diphosphate sugar epimerase/dehydratase [Dissulfurispiraceae bacterium]